MTRTAFIGALTLVLPLALGACGDLYSHHSAGAYQSNAGVTKENPPPVGPPVPGAETGSGHDLDVGANPSQGAPTGGGL